MNIEKIEEFNQSMQDQLSKVIVGQQAIIEKLVIGLLLQGHILLESVPGLGKSILAHSIARCSGGGYKRVQFTPDLMPSDIIGTTIYRSEIDDFQIKKGPIFTNILLADEVNRASAKTQSALLEAMAEGQVSLGSETHQLAAPFLCIATQNPIEMEGTYPLPEAQQDRFMMKLIMDYPEVHEEQGILYNYMAGFDHRNIETLDLQQVCDSQNLAEMGQWIKQVNVDEKIIHYITQLVRETRNHDRFSYGSSPRGAVALLLTSQAQAALNGRDYVTPDDVKELLLPVLQHRVILSPDAEIAGQKAGEILHGIIDHVEVPRS